MAFIGEVAESLVGPLLLYTGYDNEACPLSCAGPSVPSWVRPPTGEPDAGDPQVRFGGRGRRKPLPTPINDDDAGWEPLDDPTAFVVAKRHPRTNDAHTITSFCWPVTRQLTGAALGGNDHERQTASLVAGWRIGCGTGCHAGARAGEGDRDRCQHSADRPGSGDRHHDAAHAGARRGADQRRGHPDRRRPLHAEAVVLRQQIRAGRSRDHRREDAGGRRRGS